MQTHAPDRKDQEVHSSQEEICNLNSVLSLGSPSHGQRLNAGLLRVQGEQRDMPRR